MSESWERRSKKINVFYDFLFEGFMEQREEYRNLKDKAELQFSSVKATTNEINSRASNIPNHKPNANKEFFIWEKSPLFSQENIQNYSTYEKIKEKFKSEIYNESRTITHTPVYNPRVKIKDEDFYRIYPQDILNKIDIRKTCMVKNIPNKYTSQMLIDLLNEDHKGEYDFLYLRMDFKNECNVGYAFVNFNSCYSLLSFYNKIHGKRWKKFGSNKIAELTYATLQGTEQIKNKFKYSSVMNEKENYRPKLFYKKGAMKGEERAFF